MEKQKYNGWSNRPTWLVALWLDNEESLHVETRRLVREEGATPASVQDFFEEVLELEQYSGKIMGDIVAAFISDVAWSEIFEHFNED